MAINWNPWHGCHKISEGCKNCYVYRRDESLQIDSSQIRKNRDFDLPVRHTRNGGYRVPQGEFIYTCFTSDFLLPEADAWRMEAWSMMRLRSDLTFLFITKRIDRFAATLPKDWGNGYPNVRVCCTAENQDRADYRLPLFKQAPIVHKSIVCEPLLGPVDLRPYLGPWVKSVTVGGESGDAARPCDFNWVLDIRGQCIKARVPFHFKQTGYRFVKEGKCYLIARKHQHAQAAKAGIDFLYGNAAILG